MNGLGKGDVDFEDRQMGWMGREQRVNCQDLCGGRARSTCSVNSEPDQLVVRTVEWSGVDGLYDEWDLMLQVKS